MCGLLSPRVVPLPLTPFPLVRIEPVSLLQAWSSLHFGSNRRSRRSPGLLCLEGADHDQRRRAVAGNQRLDLYRPRAVRGKGAKGARAGGHSRIGLESGPSPGARGAARATWHLSIPFLTCLARNTHVSREGPAAKAPFSWHVRCRVRSFFPGPGRPPRGIYRPTYSVILTCECTSAERYAPSAALPSPLSLPTGWPPVARDAPPRSRAYSYFYRK